MTMRTTVTLADDVAEAVEGLRRERSVGVSEAINELVRAGLGASLPVSDYVPVTHHLGSGIDVTNVAEVLESLGDPPPRRRAP